MVGAPGIHEVTLAATGLKAGASKKATSFKTRSTLCKSAMWARAAALMDLWQSFDANVADEGRTACRRCIPHKSYRSAKEFGQGSKVPPGKSL
jgi:hypothetical protein